MDYPTDRFIGQIVCGDIQIEEVIGTGGMGTVYRGMKLHLNRPVAVKRISRQGETSKAMAETFERETRVLSRLRHPHIVSVLDSGRDGEGGLFLVLEHIPGQTLEALLKGEFPLPHERTLKIMIQILSALEEAHAQSIIHRDLKPGNVLLEQVAGQGDFVKVVDFGIAKILPRQDTETSPQATATQMGALMGTPRYMSPEQIQGLALDARGDIYSAGLLFFEMLTREVPHVARDIHEMMRARVLDDAPTPSKFKPELGLPLTFDWICAKALSRKLEERYGAASEMRHDLQMALSDIQLGEETSRSRQRARGLTPGSSPLLEGRGAGSGTIVALSPMIVTDANSGDQTSVERLFMIWDFVERTMARGGGVMYPLSGTLAMVVFEDLLGESSLRRAVTTTLKMRDKIERHFPFAQLQVGVAYGPMVASSVMGLPPTGVPVDTARGLVRRARGNQVLADRAHRAEFEGIFRLEPNDDAVEVVEVLIVTASSASTGERILLTTSPTLEVASISGDESELDTLPVIAGRPGVQGRLDRALDAAQRGKGLSPIVLCGPEGVGKSHALGYLRAAAHRRGLKVYQSSAQPPMADRPLKPLLDIVFQILTGPDSLLEGTSPTLGGQDGEAGRSTVDLRVSASRFGLGMAEVEALVGQWIAGTAEDPILSRSGLTPQGISLSRLWEGIGPCPSAERRMGFVAGMRRLLRRAANPWGVVVLIDDVDMADAMTLEALPGLGALASSCGVLLVVAATEARHEALGGFERLPLAPMDAEGLQACWEALLDEETPERRSRAERKTQMEKLWAASKGLPLYLARWAARPLGGGLPESLADMLFQQLLAMPAEQQRLMVMASVLGVVFEVETLRAMLPQDADHLADLAKGPGAWFEPCPHDRSLWRFTHASIQRVVISQLSIDRRRDNARRLHAMLNLLPSTPRREYSAALAAHHAGRRGAIIASSARMGDRFCLAGDLKMGGDWYLTALKALHAREGEPADARVTEELLLKATLALAMSGRLAKATAMIARASFTNAVDQSRAELILIQHWLEAGDLAQVRDLAQRTLRTTAEIPPLAVTLLVFTAEASARGGEMDKAQSFIQRALPVLHRVGGDLPRELVAVRWRAWVTQASIHGRARRFEEAELSLRTAMKQAHALKDEAGIFEVLRHMATLLSRLRKHQDLVDFCRTLLEDPAVDPSMGHQILLWRVLGQANADLRRIDEARGAFECARDLAEEGGWAAASKLLERLRAAESPSKAPNPGGWLE